MDQINSALTQISNFVWGWPMASLLLATGVVLTLRMVFIQIRGFAHGVAITSGKYDDPSHKGQLTHFQALSAALSATIGIGNIAGVAIGIYWGGPGAIFWMWVTAAFGMAIKYAECTLAIRYRKIDLDGNVRGGPMYYIELGMHRYFKPLAWMFAICTAIAAFGAGNMVQSNTMAESLVDVLHIGQLRTQLSAIVSPSVHEVVATYNETFVQMQAGLDERQALEAELQRAQEESGHTSPQVIGLRNRIDTHIVHLQGLQAQTQENRDRLLGLNLYAIEQVSGEVRIYTEDELPIPATGDSKSCRLKFGNATIDESDILLVYDGPVGAWRWVIGIVIAGLVGTVILGGIKRIGHVASFLVPVMSVVYVLSALVILLLRFDQIIPALNLIFYHAFNPTAVVGGSVGGATIWMTFTWGLRRGLFSNEAGQGSAAMAHSTAKVVEPVREGLVAMLGPFIDTIVICSMTALVIISTGMWDCGLNGASLTMAAFNEALPIYGEWMVVVGIALFAFSTVLAWSYYGEKGAEYIGGTGFKLPYKWLYVIFALLGARFDLDVVWSYADTANGLMAVPNLIALVVLSGVVVKLTKKYMDEKAKGVHRPYQPKQDHPA